MSRRRHPKLSSLIGNWMVALSDPVVSRAVPAEKLAADDVTLLAQASTLHGVRPIVFRNIEGLVSREGIARVVKDSEAKNMLNAVLAEERERRNEQAKAEALLSRLGDRIESALAEKDIRAIRAKGDVFARCLYPISADRPFGDIDILVRPGDLDRTKPVVRALGFRLDFSRLKDGLEYRLDKWVLERDHTVEIEIQANLIHSRKIGSAVGLTFDELLAAGDGDPEAPAALLIVGAVHGAAVHQFDRLQHVIDVLQGVRNAGEKIDVAQVRRAAQRAGATASLQTALDLTADIYGDADSRVLADQLNAPWRSLRRKLVTLDVILRARSVAKRRDSWRRRMLRLLITQSGKRERRINRV